MTDRQIRNPKLRGGEEFYDWKSIEMKILRLIYKSDGCLQGDVGRPGSRVGRTAKISEGVDPNTSRRVARLLEVTTPLTWGVIEVFDFGPALVDARADDGAHAREAAGKLSVKLSLAMEAAEEFEPSAVLLQGDAEREMNIGR